MSRTAPVLAEVFERAPGHTTCSPRSLVRWALSAHARPSFESFGASNGIVALDYDGTLAPIVRNLRAAPMRDSTRTLLRRVTRLYPVVIITGRDRADVHRFVRGTGVHHVVGNHGSQWSDRTQRDEMRTAEILRLWHSTLTRTLAEFAGISIERKRLSLAVHYGDAHDRRAAAGAVLRAARGLLGCRVVQGKSVCDLLPSDAPDRGEALRRACAAFRCDQALYVGDDTTEEDAFAIDGDARLLGVRVGTAGESGARYFLRKQAEIDPLLRMLCEARPQATRHMECRKKRQPRGEYVACLLASKRA